ncbi:MAG: DEAD/DEAH box helicase, partial [Fluviicola sp.]
YGYYYNRFVKGEYKKNHFIGEFSYNYDHFQIEIIQKNEGILFSCNCKEHEKYICRHISYILNNRNNFLFNNSFDLNHRNNNLLKVAKEYGLKADIEKIEELFTLELEYESVKARPLFNFLKVNTENLKSITQSILPNRILPWEEEKEERIHLLLANYNRYSKEFTLELRKAKQSKSGVLKSPIVEFESTELLALAKTPQEFSFVRALISWKEFLYTDIDSEYFDQKYQLAKDILSNPFNYPLYYFDDDGGKVTPQKLSQFEIKQVEADVILEVNQEGEFYVLSGKFEFDNRKLSSSSFKLQDGLFAKYASVLYLFENKVALKLHHFLSANNHKVFIHQSQFAEFSEAFLHPLENQVRINYSYVKKADKSDLKIAGIDKETEKLIYLSESDDYILLTPTMVYGENEIPLLSKRNLRIQLPNGEFVEAERNKWEERGFLHTIQDLHPSFKDENQFEFFYLHRHEFLENGWFLDAFEKLRTNSIQILGFAQLSKNTYNPNKAKINTQIVSGIDWFDVHTRVSFGDKEARLQDLQKAVMNRSRFVKLDDGTQGILPQDWVEKFGRFFRSAEINGTAFRTHKSHFQLIDDLFETDVFDEELRLELDKYQEKLANFHSITQTKVPKKLKATLRDYQKEGLNWLNFLDDFGFGGCLADDMGLGKTLQIIAYLMQQIEKGNTEPNLIVLPTSLLFNWKAELKKFAPHLTYSELYGAKRDVKNTDFSKSNIVFTTYGTLLSDVTVLKDFRFNCIVLDESQAIKNPDSKRYKAVRLLNGRQRLVLTGTPIENNTFDLYSQLSFAQPGLFGSAKHFSDLYSTPIDKFQDTARAKELQQKIHPFVLRRTKKQVAKELPEKTEMVIYCEMGTEQKRIYESYKKEFQAFLQGHSEEDLNKKSMHILQGMTKLRQICNSPAILGDDSFYGDESAKINELLSQIEDKKDQHKILVFSQFVRMLDLIKPELEKRNIPYCYLTGQTKDRQEQVDRFQNDDETRVFLISLKAGGTGLNLTQADYVFLIDPWWNPAVENQAIDRAYRIGQEKHVVAIRLITPDTIEEKIRELQERKKELAEDIVHTDTSVLKALNKQDLMNLL